MSAYYNEIDPKAAAWLRELIKQGLIAKGEVDERSIEDVLPSDLKGFTQCHFFAGIGGWSLALRLAKWPEDRAVWTGSCPCQPFSASGKRKGFTDERHLWPAWHWLIRECRPGVLFGEQVAGKDGRAWLDLVSSDLEGAGYACGPVVFPACGVGSPNLRSRLWFVAHSRERESWATPTARDWKSGASNLHGKNSRPLNEQARLASWSTPTAALADKGVRSAEGGVIEAMRSRGPDLAAQASLALGPPPRQAEATTK